MKKLLSTLSIGRWLFVLSIVVYPPPLQAQYRAQATASSGITKSISFTLGLPVSGHASAFNTRAEGRPYIVQNDITSDDLLPASLTIGPNYPNPFHRTTTIRYGIPHSGRVSIAVHNVLGQVVAILMAEQLKNPGYHEVIWDTSQHTGPFLSSGIYVYRIMLSPLSAGSSVPANVHTRSRSMVLIR